MKLYHFPASPNSRKTLMVIEHLGLDVEREMIDVTKGRQKEPWYLKLNPNGMVPTLTDGNYHLWESNAICAYLASQRENDLWPKDKRRYDIIRWQNWEQAHWQTAIGTLIGEYLFKPMRGLQPDQEVVKTGEEKVRRFGAVLNGHLETNKWLVGDGMTLADFAVAPMLHYRETCKLPIDSYHHLKEWFGRIEQLEAWTKTIPPKM